MNLKSILNLAPAGAPFFSFRKASRPPPSSSPLGRAPPFVTTMGPKKPTKKKPSGVKVSSQTPIFGSIEDGDKAEFDECLSRTPDCVRETNKNGWTPLHQAAFSGQLEMLNALLKAGAKLDETDHDGDTAVHYAAVQGELPCVEALAAAGAKLDVKDSDGETPVDVAVKSVKKRLKELMEEAQDEASAADEAADAVARVKLGA